MPSETFFKLPQDKKEKILTCAKQEFTRATLQDASIKNIVESAGIARGSFYQYFDSKEDLLQYMLEEHIERINNSIERSIKKTKGDIFEAFICIYDYMVNECMNKKEVQFFKKIFGEIKTAEDDFFAIDLKKHKPKTMEEYYDLIDKSNLKIEGKEDFKLLIRILQAVTKKAIVCNFKYKSKKQARLDYLKQLDYIKYGIIKPEEGGNNV